MSRYFKYKDGIVRLNFAMDVQYFSLCVCMVVVVFQHIFSLDFLVVDGYQMSVILYKGSTVCV